MIHGIEAMLSLSTSAEILHSASAPVPDLPVPTYAGWLGYLWRLVQAPRMVHWLARRLALLRPDLAICALPGPLDLLMLAALRRSRVPVVVVAHDADVHPGDGLPFQMSLQRRLLHRADAVVALSDHVASRLAEQRLVDRDKLLVLSHPPFVFGPPSAPPRAHGGPLRLLCFGRLLRYKGLDLLADALRRVGTRGEWELRVVGSGPEGAELAALRALPGVTVENRWVPEDEIGTLIAWADGVVLPYREASQSGIGPAAIAAGRYVIATRVGGLVQQLQNEPLATLCDPNAASLASALSGLLEAPPEAWPGIDPADLRLAWRDMASSLLDRVGSSVVGLTIA